MDNFHPPYLASKLAIALMSPLGTALLLWAVALVFTWRARIRGAVVAMLLGGAWLWLWSMPVAGDAITAFTENQHPPIDPQSIATAPAIVVLGGGMSPAHRTRPLPDLNDAADRVWHAARLWKAGKAPLLVLSGGSDPSASLTPEAQAMRLFLNDLGVPDRALLLEDKSRTTQENAAFTARLLRARGIDRIILVTSASHMPRAMVLFQAQGLQVTPASTDARAVSVHGHHPVLQWVPDPAALDASSRAIKEIVGRWVAGR